MAQELERHRVPFAEPGAGRASPMVSDTLIAQAPEKVARGTCAQSALAFYGKQTRHKQQLTLLKLGIVSLTEFLKQNKNSPFTMCC